MGRRKFRALNKPAASTSSNRASIDGRAAVLARAQLVPEIFQTAANRQGGGRASRPRVHPPRCSRCRKLEWSSRLSPGQYQKNFLAGSSGVARTCPTSVGHPRDRQVKPAFDRPVPLERTGRPDVSCAFAIEQPTVPKSPAKRKAASRGETAELRMHAIAPERSQDAVSTRLSPARVRRVGMASATSAFLHERASTFRRGSGMVESKTARILRPARQCDSKTRSNAKTRSSALIRTECIVSGHRPP